MIPSRDSLAARFLRALVKKGGTGLIFLTPEDLKDDTLGDDIQFTQGPDGWVCRVVGTTRADRESLAALDARLKASIAAINRAVPARGPEAADEVAGLLGSVKRLAGQGVGLAEASQRELERDQKAIDDSVASIAKVAEQTRMVGSVV